MNTLTRHRWLRRLCAALVLAAVAGPAPAPAQPVRYVIQDLGTVPGYGSVGNGINSSGQVVGYSYLPLLAFRTTATGVTGDPGAIIGSADSEGRGINDAGQVTGVGISSFGSVRAFRTTATGRFDDPGAELGTLAGYWGSRGFAINASGQVTGEAIQYPPNPVLNPVRAFRTSANGGIGDPGADLGTLGGANSTGYGINASGQVTGAAQTADGHYRAFRTTATGRISDPGAELGSLGGGDGRGAAINDSGVVVGSSFTADGFSHAFRSSPNGQPVTLTDLGTLPGDDSSAAHAVNALGELVGISKRPGSDSHAIVVYQLQMYDLNDLIPAGSGWLLTNASGINDAGQIVGTGYLGGNQHAFRLTPIPIPEPSGLALAGCTLAAWAVRMTCGRVGSGRPIRTAPRN